MYNAAMPSHRQPMGDQYPPPRQDGAYPRRPVNNQQYPPQPRPQQSYPPQQHQQPYGQYQQYPPQQPRHAYPIPPQQQYGRTGRPYQQNSPVAPHAAPQVPRQYQQPYQPPQSAQPVQPYQPVQPVQPAQPHAQTSQPQQRYPSTGSAELDPDRIHQLEAKIQQLELQLRKTSSNSPVDQTQQKSDPELASSFPTSSQNYTAQYTGDESAEQSNTGGLQYSRSIYRSNFDKAGFKSIRRKEPTTADPINEAMRNSASSSDTLNEEIKPLSPRVRRRRLPEQQIAEEDEDDFDFRGSTSSSQHAPQTVPLPDVPSDFKSMPVRSPAPRQQTIPKPVVSNLSNRSEESLRKSPARSTSGVKGSEYGGVVPPLVQKKSFDRLVLDFKNARQSAIQDYRTFTPRIQMEWAKILLEVISSKEIMTKMAIDGSMRKRPVLEKDLQAVKEQFCTTAVKVLKKIVNIDRGETRAKLYLGDLLSGGIHPGLIERDEAEGYSLFYEAALNEKDPVAMYRVGCCLEIGVGTTQSVSRALEFFNKAAEHGDPSAMCQLGILEFTGQYGRRRNIEKSIYWHVQAARTLANIVNDDILITARSFSDARGALYTLAKIYHTDLDVLCLTGNSPGVLDTIDELKRANAFRNQIKTMEYYLEAARLGHKDAQASLGYVFATGYLPTHVFKSDKAASNGRPIESVDPRKSIYWYSKAAEKGHPLAAMGLGIWYTDGVPGVLQSDPEQGFLWVRKGAEAGCPNAEFLLGTYYENGLGTVKSMEQALRWYQRAASQGYSKAIKRLQKNQMI